MSTPKSNPTNKKFVIEESDDEESDDEKGDDEKDDDDENNNVNIIKENDQKPKKLVKSGNFLFIIFIRINIMFNNHIEVLIYIYNI